MNKTQTAICAICQAEFQRRVYTGRPRLTCSHRCQYQLRNAYREATPATDPRDVEGACLAYAQRTGHTIAQARRLWGLG